MSVVALVNKTEMVPNEVCRWEVTQSKGGLAEDKPGERVFSMFLIVDKSNEYDSVSLVHGAIVSMSQTAACYFGGVIPCHSTKVNWLHERINMIPFLSISGL